MSMSKSLGLKPTLLYLNEDDILTFKSVVVPSSMRSPLWKYFGFPADENREIISRSKIVCCICYNLIAYNRNTTNLSTHLSNKHPEILTKIKNARRTSVENTSIDSPISPKRKPKAEMAINWYTNDHIQHSIVPNKMQQAQQHPTGITQKAYSRAKKSIYKPKFQITEDIDDLDDEPGKSSFDDITEHEHENQFIETIDYANIDINEDGNEIIAEVLDTESVAHSNRPKDEFLSAQYITINENNEVLYESSPKKMIITTKSPQKTSDHDNNCTEVIDSVDIMDQMKKFLIKDLVKPTIVDGTGFKEMITFLSHNTDIPNADQVNWHLIEINSNFDENLINFLLQIERSIEKDHKQQNSTAKSIVKSVVNNRCYSLLFHRLGNSSIVEISINYWADGGDRISELRNQIFCISKNCSNFLLHQSEILSNCSAIVADFDLENDLNGNEARGRCFYPHTKKN